MTSRQIATWTCILFRTADKQYILGALYGYAQLTEAEANAQMIAELTERDMIATHIIQRGTVKREGTIAQGIRR